uniref:Uncharacterized protein n=1 Tax=Eutreptiella gymnastica TaxID=73025 RepID=A0A7S1NCN3_9EUGL|mmetsp:Transcript_15563/g.27613  ORF Transcript_15563/g.27613 Transcript_15563/m.27613 type:complete len:389 (+) Transcript_15563:164-1330(+)
MPNNGNACPSLQVASGSTLTTTTSCPIPDPIAIPNLGQDATQYVVPTTPNKKWDHLQEVIAMTGHTTAQLIAKQERELEERRLLQKAEREKAQRLREERRVAAQLAEWEKMQQELTGRRTAKLAKLEEERTKQRELTEQMEEARARERAARREAQRAIALEAERALWARRLEARQKPPPTKRLAPSQQARSIGEPKASKTAALRVWTLAPKQAAGPAPTRPGLGCPLPPPKRPKGPRPAPAVPPMQAFSAEEKGVDEDSEDEISAVGDIVCVDPWLPDHWLARVEDVELDNTETSLRVKWYKRMEVTAGHYRFRAVRDHSARPTSVLNVHATVDKIEHTLELQGGTEYLQIPRAEMTDVVDKFWRVPYANDSDAEGHVVKSEPADFSD